MKYMIMWLFVLLKTLNHTAVHSSDNTESTTTESMAIKMKKSLYIKRNGFYDLAITVD